METFKIADFFDNCSTDPLPRLNALNGARRHYFEEEFDVPAKDLCRMHLPLKIATEKLHVFLWTNMAKELIRKGVIVIGAESPVMMSSFGNEVVITEINLVTGMTRVKYLDQGGVTKKGEWKPAMFVSVFQSHFPDGIVPLRTPVPRFSSAILNLPSGKERNRSSKLSYNRQPGEATTTLDELWEIKA